MYRVIQIQFEDGTHGVAYAPPDAPVHAGEQGLVEVHRVPEFVHLVAVKDQEGDWPHHPPGPMFVRPANPNDQARARENRVVGRTALKAVLRRVEELKLEIHLVSVRYSFDRSILHVVYTAEERAECGELVKALAGELRTRVDMRQTGVRDAARHAGGLGTCGRPLCCRQWLRAFDAVSVKMAKAQRMALNPSAIGGMCGRLKCCLRYEFDLYRQCGEKLPKDGARVCCGGGSGVVIDKDVLAERVKVRFEDGRVLDLDAAEVKAEAAESRRPPAGNGSNRHEDPRSQRSQPESPGHT